MQNVLTINKPRGYTPLQMITYIKKNYPSYTDKKLSYAGRLDPMAQGLLLLLIEDENKKREQYENLEKEYNFEILFGITTDTYDVLGKIVKTSTPPSPEEIEKELHNLLPTFLGKFLQTYPPYSSFVVNGKPLFYWARENKLDEITIPKRKIEIKKLTFKKITSEKTSDIIPTIIADIKKVKGEFRQKEILTDWQKLLQENPSLSLPLATLSLTCTSGTYVRTLSHRIGQELGCGAIAYKIKRTRVGNFTLDDALIFRATQK